MGALRPPSPKRTLRRLSRTRRLPPGNPVQTRVLAQEKADLRSMSRIVDQEREGGRVPSGDRSVLRVLPRFLLTPVRRKVLEL